MHAYIHLHTYTYMHTYIQMKRKYEDFTVEDFKFIFYMEWSHRMVSMYTYIHIYSHEYIHGVVSQDGK